MIERIKAWLGAEQVLEEEPLAQHTTFRIGGPARAVLVPRDLGQLQELVRLLKREGERFLILGNGSNLLVPDEGVEVPVIKIEAALSKVEIHGTQIIAEAGALLSTLSQAALSAGLTGLEFASGIPGTLGGAVFMNAGAYDGEMSDVVRWVEVIDEQGDLAVVDRSAMDFGYRTSAVRRRGWIVTRVCMELRPGDQEGIAARIADLTERRVSKQPLEWPSAGSVFKRPPRHYAGQLIQEAGLSGVRIGGAQVSEKHCGFIINAGGATCSDVLALVDHVCDVVKSRYGVALEREIRVFGKE